nr:hypothetical protein [Tanacetum cinerariifolium]
GDGGSGVSGEGWGSGVDGGEANGVAAMAAYQRRLPGSDWWVAVWGRRVEESDILDRVDRKVRINFGFAGKIPAEKFSGGGRPAVAGCGLPEIWRR